MKKSNKILLILSIICIVVGLGIAGCGISQSIVNGISLDKEIVTQEIGDSFENVTVSIPYENVSIISEGSVAKVSYPKSMQKDLTISSNSGTLNISGFTDWYALFKLNLFWHTSKVTITLPANWKGNVVINGQSGNVSVSGLQRENTVDIKTGSGNLQVADCTLSSLNLNQNSGNISINTTKILNTLSVQGRSGNLKINSSECKYGNLEISSGNVNLTEFTAEETLIASTHSGNITLTKVDSPSLTLHSDSGNISGTIASEKIFTVSTNSGTVNVPASSGTETCEITTKSGNVNIKIV